MSLEQIADKVIETDVLVIGGGVAGCCVAVLGLRDVPVGRATRAEFVAAGARRWPDREAEHHALLLTREHRQWNGTAPESNLSKLNERTDLASLLRFGALLVGLQG